MRKLADLVVRLPWLFIGIFVAITLGFATRLPDIEIDPEVKNQLPEDMPARVSIRRIEERFGGSEMVLVVLSAPDVLDPAVLGRLDAIGDDLEKLDFVDRVLTPFTLTDISGDESGMMVVKPAIDADALPSTPEERAAVAEALKANELVFGNVVAKDFSAIAAIAMLGTEATDEVTMTEVERVVAAHPGPGTIEVGGMPDVRTHVSEDIRGDFRRFLPIGLLIVLGFLYVCFRQLRGVLLPFAVVVMSVVVAMGLIPMLGWKVQMMTVTLPVILLAIANDYGIHLMARFQEENIPGKERDRKTLARVVLEELGTPVAAAGVTTIAGLLCLTTHIVVPARQLGVLAATGVLFALVASLGFIPAVLAVLPVPKPLPSLTEEHEPKGLELLLDRTSRLVARNPWPVIVGVVIFTLLSGTGMAYLEVDTNPVNYYDADAPVSQTTQLINDHFGGSTEVAVMFEGDIQAPEVLGRIDALEQTLRANEDVGFTSSIAQVVRMMSGAVSGGERSLPAERDAVAQLFGL